MNISGKKEFGLRAILFVSVVTLAWNLIRGFGFSTFDNSCTNFDGFVLPILFVPLLSVAVIVGALSLVSKKELLVINFFVMSIFASGLLFTHNLLQFLFNNKSEQLIVSPFYLTPFVPLLLGLILYLLQRRIVINQTRLDGTWRIVIKIMRIAFYTIFATSMLAILFHHYNIVSATFIERGQLINEFNCGAHPASPDFVPPPDINI